MYERLSSCTQYMGTLKLNISTDPLLYLFDYGNFLKIINVTCSPHPHSVVSPGVPLYGPNQSFVFPTSLSCQVSEITQKVPLPFRLVKSSPTNFLQPSTIWYHHQKPTDHEPGVTNPVSFWRRTSILGLFSTESHVWGQPIKCTLSVRRSVQKMIQNDRDLPVREG